MWRLALPLFLGACVSTQTYEADLAVPAGTKVALEDVLLDYAEWTTDSARVLDPARAHEEEIAARIGQAFVAEATTRGILGEGATVTIRVTDLRPGRHGMAWWVGSDDERAYLEARVELAGHGGFTLELEGPKLAKLLETLGKRAAKRIDQLQRQA